MLTFTTSKIGLQSLQYEGQEFISDPISHGEFSKTGVNVAFRRPDNTTYQAYTRQTGTSFQANMVKKNYPWGWASCRYRQRGNKLYLQLEVFNSSAETLSYLQLYLMSLTFPSIPTVNTANNYPGFPLHTMPIWADPLEGPGELMLRYQSGTLALCNQEPINRHFRVGVPASNKSLKVYYITAEIREEIAPHTTASYNLYYSFGKTGATAQDLAPKVYRRFLRQAPESLEWKDRRMIGAAFIANKNRITAQNPNGWYPDNDSISIVTPQGRLNLRQKLLQYADRCVKNIQFMGGQGVIVWDLEGMGYETITYVGDPRMLDKLSPEMEYKRQNEKQATVDLFFKKFSDAGLKVGVCLRPTQIELRDGKYYQIETRDPVQVLSDKIAYCQKRWGATLFYIDSNSLHNPSALYWKMPAQVFKKLRDLHPNVLLIPEHKNAPYYACTAPYGALLDKYPITPPPIRRIYPRSFSVINVGASKEVLDKNKGILLQAIREGDILLCGCWYPQYYIDFVRQLYSEK